MLAGAGITYFAIQLDDAEVLERVEEDIEHGGLDRDEHGEEAYNWEA